LYLELRAYMFWMSSVIKASAVVSVVVKKSYKIALINSSAYVFVTIQEPLNEFPWNLKLRNMAKIYCQYYFTRISYFKMQSAAAWQGGSSFIYELYT
jgi:hypothetical protein